MGPARAAKRSRLLLFDSDFLQRRSTGASKLPNKPVNDLVADYRCVACLTTFRRVCYCLCPPDPTRGKECSGQTAPGDRSPVIQEKDGRPFPTRSRRVHQTRAFGRHEVGPCPGSTGTAAATRGRQEAGILRGDCHLRNGSSCPSEARFLDGSRTVPRRDSAVS